MGKYTRAELLEAFEDYKRRRDIASQTGDWNVWADCFAEDAHYIEHAYGELHGREAIRTWICDVMAPFPTMTFPITWLAVDEETGAIVWEVRNAFPEPFQPSGEPYSFPNWSRLVYAGGSKWKSEEDVYNPARDSGRTFKAWIKAGGKTRSGERVKMAHR
jgi:SnoaL-like domain